MKYIITESRLLQVIYKFLDRRFPDITEINGIVYFGEPDDGDMLIDIENKLLLIRSSFVETISGLFGISERESIRIVKSYVNHKGYKVERVV